MKNFTTYLSTAPVVASIWFLLTASLLIELNRFFPDSLIFQFINKENYEFSLFINGNKPIILDFLIFEINIVFKVINLVEL